MSVCRCDVALTTSVSQTAIQVVEDRESRRMILKPLCHISERQPLYAVSINEAISIKCDGALRASADGCDFRFGAIEVSESNISERERITLACYNPLCCFIERLIAAVFSHPNYKSAFQEARLNRRLTRQCHFNTTLQIISCRYIFELQRSKSVSDHPRADILVSED